MSIQELLIILVVSIVIFKPEDYGSIIKNLRSFIAWCKSIKCDVDHQIDELIGEVEPEIYDVRSILELDSSRVNKANLKNKDNEIE